MKNIYIKKNTPLKVLKRFFAKKETLMPHQIRYKYGIPENIKLEIKLKKNGWYVVKSPDLPGLMTQARNPKKLYEMINDAVLTYYDVPNKEGSEVFNQIKIDGLGTIKSTESFKTQAA
jgi:predicted RNase H-like HicB family nuclease